MNRGERVVNCIDDTIRCRVWRRVFVYAWEHILEHVFGRVDTRIWDNIDNSMKTLRSING